MNCSFLNERRLHIVIDIFGIGTEIFEMIEKICSSFRIHIVYYNLKLLNLQMFSNMTNKNFAILYLLNSLMKINSSVITKDISIVMTYLKM